MDSKLDLILRVYRRPSLTSPRLHRHHTTRQAEDSDSGGSRVCSFLAVISEYDSDTHFYSTMAASEQAPQKDCRLLALPPELRNYMYDLALPHSSTISRNTPPVYQVPLLLATCRQIRTEACGLLFSSREFHIPFFEFYFLRRWMRASLGGVQGRVTLRIYGDLYCRGNTAVDVWKSRMTARVLKLKEEYEVDANIVIVFVIREW